MRTFSRTVAPGRRLVIWYERAIAFFEMRCGGSPVMSSPSNTMRPLVGVLLDLHALERLDELHRILTSTESRLLDAELEEVHRLEVGLHVAVGIGARGIHLLEQDLRFLEELLVVRRVERLGKYGDVAVDPDEALDLVAERREMRRLGDGAVARVLAVPEQSEIEGLVGERHRIGAEHDREDAVEGARDLGDERRHVRGAERDRRGADDLAAVLLDLLGVGVTRRLARRVVEIDDVPLV